MAPNISGKWVLDTNKSESPDGILTLQGMGWAKRKIAGSVSVSLEITQEADKMRLQMTSSVKSDDQTIPIGGDFAVIKIDDIDTEAKVYIDGDHIVSEHKFVNTDNKKTHRTIRRYVEGNTLVQVTTVKLVDSGEEATCKRYFNKA